METAQLDAYFLLLFHPKFLYIYLVSTQLTKPLRDDQMRLLVWSAKVVGISVPDNLNKFLFRKQENHGLAKWLATDTGYLRLLFELPT